jgi:hypothetical protein
MAGSHSRWDFREQKKRFYPPGCTLLIAYLVYAVSTMDMWMISVQIINTCFARQYKNTDILIAQHWLAVGEVAGSQLTTYCHWFKYCHNIDFQSLILSCHWTKVPEGQETDLFWLPSFTWHLTTRWRPQASRTSETWRPKHW